MVTVANMLTRTVKMANPSVGLEKLVNITSQLIFFKIVCHNYQSQLVTIITLTEILAFFEFSKFSKSMLVKNDLSTNGLTPKMFSAKK